MPGNLFSFDPPDRFVLGTVGQPGERTFFLQASDSDRVISVALEKVQAQLLAERLDDLLDEIRRRGFDVPPVAPPELEDLAPLDQPLLEEFRAGTLALSWDGEDSLVVIEAQSRGVDAENADEEETDAEPTDAEDTGDVLRVRLRADVARAFVKRSLRIIASGRPPCPLCGQPLDEGHICPRQNGHRH